LEFAHDTAQKGEPLDDWNQCTGLSSKLVYKSQDLVARLYNGCCCFKKTSGGGNTKVEQGGVKSGAEGSGGSGFLTPAKLKSTMGERLGALQDTSRLKRQQLRLDVLRAFSFIDAHNEAGDRLHDEFGEGTPETRSAFKVVMQESRVQVRKANAVLQGKNKKELRHVISHYLCVTLLNKHARYVKVLLDSGVLLQREASQYLEEIDHSIIDIRACPMEEHPGTILTLSEEDEEQEGKARRRRKRVKQKSLL
jgi:hypothetical protein